MTKITSDFQFLAFWLIYATMPAQDKMKVEIQRYERNTPSDVFSCVFWHYYLIHSDCRSGNGGCSVLLRIHPKNPE